jgi:hypothetical protein
MVSSKFGTAKKLRGTPPVCKKPPVIPPPIPVWTCPPGPITVHGTLEYEPPDDPPLLIPYTIQLTRYSACVYTHPDGADPATCDDLLILDLATNTYWLGMFRPLGDTVFWAERHNAPLNSPPPGTYESPPWDYWAGGLHSLTSIFTV